MYKYLYYSTLNKNYKVMVWFIGNKELFLV